MKSLIEAPLYKYIIPRPLQKTTRVRDLKIIVPAELKWKDLGQLVADELKKRWNINAEINTPDQQRSASGWTGNTLILGNLGNNVQIGRLYGSNSAYSDASYPGKGGYQLLTLVNPFGLGGNTIVIRASEINGAAEGVKQFIDILKEKENPEIHWVLKTKLSEETNNFFTENTGLVLKAWEAAKKLKPIMNDETTANSLINMLDQIKLYGEYYQLTADPAFGEVYSVLLKEYTRFVNQYPEASLNQLESQRNILVQGEKLFQHWAVLEASPLFTQLERGQILSALYLTCEANANRHLVEPPKAEPQSTYKISSAVSLLGSCNYFEKYYKMPEIRKWKESADQILRSNTSYK